MQRSGGAVERRPDVVARRVVAAATGASRKGNDQRDWRSALMTSRVDFTRRLHRMARSIVVVRSTADARTVRSGAHGAVFCP